MIGGNVSDIMPRKCQCIDLLHSYHKAFYSYTTSYTPVLRKKKTLNIPEKSSSIIDSNQQIPILYLATFLADV